MKIDIMWHIILVYENEKSMLSRFFFCCVVESNAIIPHSLIYESFAIFYSSNDVNIFKCPLNIYTLINSVNRYIEWIE